MKKIIVLFVIILFCFLAARSQDFAPLGAKWHYTEFKIDYYGAYTYSKVEVVSDTIIDDKYSTVLQLHVNNAQNFVAEVIIHEHLGKVYFYEFNEFKLFFDYNLGIGDTLKYYLPSNANLFDNACGVASSSEKVYYALISDIDTININGEEILKFYTEVVVPEGYDNSYSLWNLGVFIERIGSEYDLFGISETQCLGGFPGFFRCYQDNEIECFLFDVCDYTTVEIAEVLNENDILIYPNPVTDIINISYNESYSVSFKLYDIKGNIILSKNLNTTSQISLDSIKTGLYIYVINVNGQKKYGKLIKK